MTKIPPECQCGAVCKWPIPTNQPFKPKERDIWICPICLRISVFVLTEVQFELRELTEEEFAQYPVHIQAWFRGTQFALLMLRRDSFYDALKKLDPNG